MAKSKMTGLGRGLDAIFEDNSSERSENVTMLRVSEVEPRPDQPRKDFDPESLAELADSIATHGLIQPVIVRPGENGFYQIIAGERRWRASKMAGLTEIPVVIIEADDRKAAELSLIENIQREDLNAIEEAEAYKSLANEHELTQEEISKQVSKSRSAIANSLRLLDLPDEVRVMIKNNELSAGHARALLALKEPEKIVPMAMSAKNKGLSVRALEQTVKNVNKAVYEPHKMPNPNLAGEPVVDYISELAGKMSSKLGRRVNIFNTGKDKKIEIHYHGNDDLNQIIKLLCGDNIFDDN